MTVRPRPVRREPMRPVPGVIELAARARAERSARRGRTGHRLLRGLCVLFPLAGLAWVLLVSSWLAVDRIQVVGAGRLAAAQVQAAAAVDVGTPLARVDAGAVEQRVGRLAPVAAVTVSRSWPGTLRVAVTERVAAAGVVTSTGVSLLDDQGVSFATEKVLPAGLVRLQVHSPGPTDPATLAALQVRRELPSPLLQRVRIMRAASASEVVLLLADGRQVVWGAPGDTAVKAAAALALLRVPGSVYDVSAEGVAVVRQGAGTTTPGS